MCQERAQGNAEVSNGLRKMRKDSYWSMSSSTLGWPSVPPSAAAISSLHASCINRGRSWEQERLPERHGDYTSSTATETWGHGDYTSLTSRTFRLLLRVF